MTRLVLLACVIACGACGSKEPASVGTGSGSERPLHLPAPKFAIELDGVPDEPDWRAAAGAVANGWAESFNRLEAAKAIISPVKTPDGAIAKFLLRAKAIKSDGSKLFEGVALVSEHRMINGSGPRRLEAHLVINDNYFCRATTITFAGRGARPEGTSDRRSPLGFRWSPTSRSGC